MSKVEEPAEPAPKRAKQQARALCRAAARAAERADWLGDRDEINKLLAQITEIDRDPDVVGPAEYELISDRLRQREQESRCFYAAEASKPEHYTCGICLEKKPLFFQLHVIVPCGHGFCEKCMAKARADYEASGANLDPEWRYKCPWCHKPVDEVVKVRLDKVS